MLNINAFIRMQYNYIAKNIHAFCIRKYLCQQLLRVLVLITHLTVIIMLKYWNHQLGVLLILIHDRNLHKQ